MSFLSVFRQPMLAILPALLVASACSKKEAETIIPAPDVARVLSVHAAVNNSLRPIKVTVGDKVGPSVAYGTNTAYQTVDVGNKPLLADIDASGGARLYGSAATFAKDKYYSFFAYSSSTQSTGTVSGLLAEDDLSAPANGMAKVRLVHVGQDLVSPLTLSKPDNNGVLTGVTTATTSGQASAFVNVPAGINSYNLANSSNSAIQPVFGSAVLGTSFEAGKIYSIVIEGATNGAAPSNTEKFTLKLILHN